MEKAGGKNFIYKNKHCSKLDIRKLWLKGKSTHRYSRRKNQNVEEKEQIQHAPIHRLHKELGYGCPSSSVLFGKRTLSLLPLPLV
jgi:hypothetical protein